MVRGIVRGIGYKASEKEQVKIAKLSFAFILVTLMHCNLLRIPFCAPLRGLLWICQLARDSLLHTFGGREINFGKNFTKSDFLLLFLHFTTLLSIYLICLNNNKHQRSVPTTEKRMQKSLVRLSSDSTLSCLLRLIVEMIDSSR